MKQNSWFPAWFFPVVILAVLGGFNGCQLFSRGPSHVLLVTVDGLRPDRLGILDGDRSVTPNLDSLAAESTRFRRASTHAVLTAPAAASLLTGTLPPTHGIRGEAGFRLRPQVPTLAQRLGRAGYRSAAVLGTSSLDPVSGMNRDFWSFLRPPLIQMPVERRAGEEYRAAAGEVNLAAMNWLRINLQYRTFIWVHYRDLHYPYQTPGSDGKLAPAEYVEALTYVDGELGGLLDAYRSLQILDDTLVIVTATHGESLGEHGELTHSNFLFDSTLRVPLLVRVGEANRDKLPPGEVPGLVGLVDLVPTVLDLTGLGRDDSLPGRSLAPVARGADPEAEPEVYAEALGPLLRFGWTAVRSLETADRRLTRSGDRSFLSRVPEDPDRLDDLSGAEPELAGALSDRLEGVAGGGDPIWDGGTDLDREVRIGLLADLNRATRSFGEGNTDSAEATLRSILKRDPGNLHASRLLAIILQRRREGAAAETVLREMVDRHPDLAEASIQLGTFYAASDRPLEAVSAYLTAFEADPDRLPLLVLAAEEESKAGRLEEAVYWMERAVEKDPASAYLQALAAEFFWEFLDYEKALSHLQRAWDLNKGEIPDPLKLGECLQQLARFEEALKAFQAAEKEFPDRVSVQVTASKIGDAYLLLERENAAVEEYRRTLPPGDPLGRDIGLANILSSKGRPDLALEILQGIETRFPGSPQIHYVRGEILLTEKDFSGAEAEFRRVLEIDPGNRPTRYNLARIALLRGDEETGLGFLRAAMKDDDGSMRKVLIRDQLFWQTREGSPLTLYLQELLQSETGQ